MDVGDGDADSGGFLYIPSINVSSDDSSNGATDVVSQVISKFLNLAELSTLWTLAVYVPESRGWWNRSQCRSPAIYSHRLHSGS